MQEGGGGGRAHGFLRLLRVYKSDCDAAGLLRVSSILLFTTPSNQVIPTIYKLKGRGHLI